MSTETTILVKTGSNANPIFVPVSASNPMPVASQGYVWDTGTLAWVKQTSGGGGPTANVNVTNASLATTDANIDVALSTRLKPADTLAGVTAVGSITNNVNTVEVAPTTVAHNKVVVTTAGTRVQFSTATLKSIVIKAIASNTGLIYVGGSAVAGTNGFQLSAGDAVALDINQASTIYVDASISGEGVTWMGNN